PDRDRLWPCPASAPRRASSPSASTADLAPMPPATNFLFEIGDVLAAPDFGSFALAPDRRHPAPARIASVRSPELPPSPARGFAFLSFATREEQGSPDPIVWGEPPRAGFRHLWCVDDLGAPARRLTDGPEDVYDFCWSPDGERLAVLAAPGFEMEKHLDNE